jgi:choline dehydrogenase-like flavoprotein
MAEAFEAVVVGSGFGGTILALSFANRFEKENGKNNTSKKVCILERGQWWLSHELNYTPKANRKRPLNMREFLEDNGRPYHTWAHPDSVTGVDESELKRLLDKQECICQRQGRCVLGCIPGARHTFGQYLAAAMNPKPPARPKPIEPPTSIQSFD